jgi:hypothetical protein
MPTGNPPPITPTKNNRKIITDINRWIEAKSCCHMQPRRTWDHLRDASPKVTEAP